MSRIAGGSAKKPGGGFRIMSDGKLITRPVDLTVIVWLLMTGPEIVETPWSRISRLESIAPAMTVG